MLPELGLIVLLLAAANACARRSSSRRIAAPVHFELPAGVELPEAVTRSRSAQSSAPHPLSGGGTQVSTESPPSAGTFTPVR